MNIAITSLSLLSFEGTSDNGTHITLCQVNLQERRLRMNASDFLEPRFELLSAEYVLVQAWKKTASYIRLHNWYSDTLELDQAAVNLPQFLSALAQELKKPQMWTSDQLRVVPAPQGANMASQFQDKPLDPLIINRRQRNYAPLLMSASEIR